MSFPCSCPLPTALTDIPFNPCQDIFGKEAKWFFQRQDDTGNAFVSGVNGIELEASWTPLPTASDDTKVIMSPFLEEGLLNEPDKLEDSENIDGAPVAVGAGPMLFQTIVRNPTPAQYAAVKDLMCEPALTVYRIDDNGLIGCREISDAPATYAGLIISPKTFWVPDPSKGGTKVDQSKLMIQFYLKEDWFRSFRVIKPETGFNPLYDVSI